MKEDCQPHTTGDAGRPVSMDAVITGQDDQTPLDGFSTRIRS